MLAAEARKVAMVGSVGTVGTAFTPKLGLMLVGRDTGDEGRAPEVSQASKQLG